MAGPRGFRTYDDFERQEIRPGLRIGWTLDDVEAADQSDIDLSADPFEAMLDAHSEAADNHDDDEDDE